MGCCEVQVLVAEDRHVPSIVAMVAQFLAETAYGRLFPFDEPRITDLVRTTRLLGVIFVAETPSGHPVGMVAAVKVPSLLAPLEVVEELAWWVAPASRGKAGTRLLGALEDWARASGCALLKMVAPAAQPRVGDYYAGRGYQQVETAWVLDFRGTDAARP